MVNQDIVRMARFGQVAIVLRQILEPLVGGLDEDFGVVACGAKHALDAEDFVTDGVAIPEGRQDLMNRDRHGYCCIRLPGVRLRGRRPRRRDLAKAGWTFPERWRTGCRLP